MSYPVTVVHNHWIKLSDGVRLACRSWLPLCKPRILSFFSETDDIQELIPVSTDKTDDDAEEFPIILEILPYWKDIFTLERDMTRHTRFAQMGYVVCRVEMRGTGNSDGFYFDEYTDQEMRDTEEVIDYLGTQGFSNGKVAMFGKSWGGFNGLQLAARRPKHLAAVISAYSTDDRFDNDIHYLGGCVLGDGMVNWSNIMHLWNSRPPNPKYCTDWKEKWLERLEKSSEPWLKTWLSEQNGQSAYWKHGSIKYQYEKIDIPILLISGILDGYTDGAFRMIANLNERCKAIIGPWGHGWPDNSLPAPNIDFVDICNSWLSQHCKGSDMGVGSWPRLSVFLREPQPPATSMQLMKGSWIGLERYSDRQENSKIGSYRLAKGQRLVDATTADIEPDENRTLNSNVMQGFHCGQWMSWGAGEGLPGDQYIANALSACWTSEPFEFDVYLCGYAWVRLKAKGKGEIVCRLCCEDESGTSTLVSYGVTAISSSERFTEIVVRILPSAFTFSAGARLKLAVAPSCFPKILPSALKSTIELDLNTATFAMQLVDVTAMSNSSIPGLSKQPDPLFNIEKLTHSPGSRTESLSIDLDRNIAKHTRIATTPHVAFPGFGLEFHETAADIFKASLDLSEVSVKGDRSMSLKQEGLEGEVTLNAKASLEHKGDVFEISQFLRVTMGGVVFFERAWNDVVPNNTC